MGSITTELEVEWVTNNLLVTGPLEERVLFALRSGYNTLNDLSFTAIYPPPNDVGYGPEMFRWRSQHWGTVGMKEQPKVDFKEKNSLYEIMTPFSPPSGIIKQLGLMYPKLKFHLRYENENFSGQIIAKGTKYTREHTDKKKQQQPIDDDGQARLQALLNGIVLLPGDDIIKSLLK